MPTDADWPHALNGLGFRARYLLWTHGAASFLSGGPADRTRSSVPAPPPRTAQTSRRNSPAPRPRNEHTIVSGCAYGIADAAHYVAPAGGDHAIAIPAGGGAGAYPRGHTYLVAQGGNVGLLASEMVLKRRRPGTGSLLSPSRRLAPQSGARLTITESQRSSPTPQI
ncbi:DNA-processing protein DprA [Corynebacterium glyciniphilum]|uniref:DNA-processing protein DprA n=1 Tax=Corynebacterium glyciniphilum TaxID=1404244 RepID=UPI003FD0EC7B